MGFEIKKTDSRSILLWFWYTWVSGLNSHTNHSLTGDSDWGVPQGLMETAWRGSCPLLEPCSWACILMCPPRSPSPEPIHPLAHRFWGNKGG